MVWGPSNCPDAFIVSQVAYSVNVWAVVAGPSGLLNELGSESRTPWGLYRPIETLQSGTQFLPGVLLLGAADSFVQPASDSSEDPNSGKPS